MVKGNIYKNAKSTKYFYRNIDLNLHVYHLMNSEDIMGTSWTSAYTSPISLITITPNWKQPSKNKSSVNYQRIQLTCCWDFIQFLLCPFHQTRLPTYTNCNWRRFSSFRYTMVILPLAVNCHREHFREGFLRSLWRCAEYSL